MRIVATLGLLAAGFTAFMAFPGAIFMLFVALSLFLINWQMLQNVGGFGGRR